MSRKAIFVTAGVTRGICTVRLPGYAPVVAVAVGAAPGETWNGASAQMVAYSAPAGATPDRVLLRKFDLTSNDCPLCRDEALANLLVVSTPVNICF